MLLSTTCAYAFARMQFRFKSQTLSALLLLQMFPAVLALVAIYAIFDLHRQHVPWLGIDSHGSLVLAYTGGIAMHIWTIKGYYRHHPDRDRGSGQGRRRHAVAGLCLVLLPMAVPILMVVFVLAFIGAIIEYPVASCCCTNRTT